MKQRFFFDRINVNSAWPTVGDRPQLAVHHDPRTAVTALALLDTTSFRAEFADEDVRFRH
jgi:hypothetical protein